MLGGSGGLHGVHAVRVVVLCAAVGGAAAVHRRAVGGAAVTVRGVVLSLHVDGVAVHRVRAAHHLYKLTNLQMVGQVEEGREDTEVVIMIMSP